MDPVITVGLDGSPESLTAVPWAADAAERRKLTLRLLHAWSAASRDVPLRVAHGEPVPLHAHAPRGVDHDVTEETTRNAQQRLHQALRPWRERFPHVEVPDSIVLESPAEAVVRAAEGARLSVVGRRKHRPALAARPGPVAPAIRHTRCPVAVVPHE